MPRQQKNPCCNVFARRFPFYGRRGSAGAEFVNVQAKIRGSHVSNAAESAKSGGKLMGEPSDNFSIKGIIGPLGYFTGKTFRVFFYMVMVYDQIASEGVGLAVIKNKCVVADIVPVLPKKLQ